MVEDLPVLQDLVPKASYTDCTYLDWMTDLLTASVEEAERISKRFDR